MSHESYLSAITPGLHLLKETIVSSLRLAQETPKSSRIVLAGELLSSPGGVKVIAVVNSSLSLF